MIDAITTITVNGTRKSASAGGLDDGERSTFTIKPGQYDKKIYSVDDLLNQINEQAFFRGEWISSLKIGSMDIVEDIIEDLLQDLQENISDTFIEMSQLGMFCNASGDDLIPLISIVSDRRRRSWE